MKKLSDILGGSLFEAPVAGEVLDPSTKKMADSFKVTKTEYKPGSPEAQDELFNATNVKTAKKPVAEMTDEDLAEAAQLTEVFGLFGSRDEKNPGPPEHHHEMAGHYMEKLRQHAVDERGYEDALKNKNLDGKTRRLFKQAMDGHASLKHVYANMADHHLVMLNAAHKNAVKGGARK